MSSGTARAEPKPADAPKEAPAERRDRPARGEGRMPGPLGEILTALSEMDLSEEQRAQLREIAGATRSEFQAQREDMESMSPEERRNVMKQMIDDARAKVDAVLAEPQRTQLDEAIERARQLRREGREGRDAPTSRPSGRALPMVERISNDLNKLDLSDEQKTQVKSVLDDLRAELTKLQDDAGGDPQAVREGARALMEGVVVEIGEILTPEQREKMRAMRDQAGPRERRGDRAGPPPGEAGPMPGEAGPRPERRRARDRGDQPPPPPEGEPQTRSNPEAGATGLAALQEGGAFPAIPLTRLDGKPVALNAGRPVLMVLGSYSSPMFRDQAAAFQTLGERLSRRADVVFVYTREAHPSDAAQPERNVVDEISVAPHRSVDERFVAARAARDQLTIRLSVAPEPFDDPISKSLGSASGIILLDGKGVVRHLRKWANPVDAETLLLAVLNSTR
jgi:Spy/CpxP family protein refolding chaperone